MVKKMKIEGFYSVLRFIASKQLGILFKKDYSNWEREWKEFHLKNLIGPAYEKNLVPEFRQKQKEKGRDKGWKARFERLDYMLCWAFFGAVPEDYFSMVFFKKGWFWRNHHVTRLRLNFLQMKFNPNSTSCDFVDDKAIFCKIWNDYLHRKWCNIEETSIEEFEEKFKDVKRIIAKTRTGYGGKGIMVFDTAKTGYSQIYNEILSQKEPYMAEEYHVQSGWLHKVNPSSLNTIRVCTFSLNGKTDVIFAYLRVGAKGSIVDNLHSGGIRFPIDHHTGKIHKGMNYQVFDLERHPDSGVQLYGEVIPRWDEIIDLCKEAHELAPDDLHLIGWDVCLDEDDIILIEANSGPGFPPIEDPHEDWWKDMKNYLSQLDSS